MKTAKFSSRVASRALWAAPANTKATVRTVLASLSLDGMSAVMSGKLKIGGDMGLAMKLQSLFSG